MIRHYDELTKLDMQHKGGKGHILAAELLSGTGLYFDNGELKPVTAGDVMICKDGEEHMLENDGTEDLEFIALILYA